MKRALKRTMTAGAALVTMALIGLGGVTAPADAGPSVLGTVTVTGTGSTTVQRDRATTSLSVSVLASTAKDAMAQASRTYNSVRAAILQLGVKATDLTTSGVSLYPEYDYPAPAGTPVLRGYRAVISLNVASDVTTAAAVLDTAVSVAGDAVQIGGVSFDVVDPEAVGSKARTAAIANAKLHAVDFAKALGEHIGRATKIVESGSSVPTPIYYGVGKGGVASADAISVDPGTQKVSASVTVTFELLA